MIPGSGRSPGEGNGNLLQYSCLGNPIDRGAWGALVHDVAKVRQNLTTKSSSTWEALFFLMVTKKSSRPPRRGHRVHIETETAKADPHPKVGSIGKKKE